MIKAINPRLRVNVANAAIESCKQAFGVEESFRLSESKRAHRYGCLIAALAIGLCATWPSGNVIAANHPNVVLMMADDMGMGDTSAYQDFTGNDDHVQIATPQMERLARMGVRFTDAHTPSSRCSPTRYALLTGRYPWRNRLKHWVLFGVQGDPMIEADRPTIATLMKDQGYRTAMVGKWHVGLRYRRSDGKPAAGWTDADLTQPLFDTPLDHGFDFCRFTSRSHGTSGVAKKGKKKANGPKQSVGPGHLHGRTAVSATGNGKQLVEDHQDEYVLSELGGRHSDHAIGFLDQHLSGESTQTTPFFLYYPSNSNHGPYTPDTDIVGEPVAGAARNKAGEAMDTRSDYVYENDVALGRLIDYLQQHDDPRNLGKKLIDNTIVIFTSDNGAERDDNVATGPFRSNKGSAYEGGHRVPFIVTWKNGNVGDGDPSTPGQTSQMLIGMQDMFATFADVTGAELPDLRQGQKGGEDSYSVLAAWRGQSIDDRPMFFHDHKQAKDHAASAIRLDAPVVNGRQQPGHWKLFFDATLLRAGEANPIELFELSGDARETVNRIDEPELQPLIKHLSQQAELHRNCGGHRAAQFAPQRRIVFDWLSNGNQQSGDTIRVGLADQFHNAPTAEVKATLQVEHQSEITLRVSASKSSRPIRSGKFIVNPRGLGIDAGKFDQVDEDEALRIRFDHDVIVESASIVAGNGTCGGFYRIGDRAPLAIYCVDADIDAQDQSGLLSDIGVLKAGEVLTLSSEPHFGVEAAGRWRLGSLTVRLLNR